MGDTKLNAIFRAVFLLVKACFATPTPSLPLSLRKESSHSPEDLHQEVQVADLAQRESGTAKLAPAASSPFKQNVRDPLPL